MADVKDKPAKVEGEAKEEDEESEEEVLGLLEREVEIFDTRRERKKVERLTLESDARPKRKAELDFSKGRGMKLGDLEIVRYEISRSLATELKPLHKLLYKQLGKPATIKKNIFAFCGFPFEKDSKEYADFDWQMEKFAKMGLLRLCEIFGLSLKGNRDELKARIMEFLMAPFKTDKKVPEKASKPSKTKSKKRKSEASDKNPGKKKKSSEDIDEEMASEEHEEEEKDEEEDDEKEKKKKEKPKKKESKSKQKKSTVIKLPTPSKKKKEKEKNSKKEASVKKAKTQDSDSDEDEPLSKMPKGPSDDELERVVRDLLDGADLETVTMKMICKQVFEKFPNEDLTERKSFIKETVKQIIS